MAATKRIVEINPYNPYPTEALGADVTTGIPEFGQEDIGKPTKMSGDTNVLCASGDEIDAFIISVSVATNGGVGTGTFANRKGQAIQAIDEVGTLAVGDFVVAGTAVAVKTNPTTARGLSNVLVGTPTALSMNRWVVKAVDVVGNIAGAGQVINIECV